MALHKHYSEDEYVAYFNGLKRKSTAFYSMGITDNDLKKFKAVMERAPGAIEYLCIDVANGYTEIFVDFVSKNQRRIPAPCHHGRQRRHRRHDGRIDPGGR